MSLQIQPYTKRSPANLFRFVCGTSVSLLSLSALAQDAAPATAQQPASPLMQLPIFIAIFALFYFAFIRPQRQQQKKHQAFVSGLKVGDEIVTSSGIVGTIRGLNDRLVTLEVNPDSEIRLLRSQIQGALKDYLKTEDAKK